MADDVTLPGDGAVVATDEVGGRHFQIAKLAYGADGTATQASDTSPLPVKLTGVPAPYLPGYSGSADTGPRPLQVDDDGSLQVRAAVLTDEGTFRANFANSSLFVGLGAVTVSGATVSGAGFLSADVHKGDYFKIAADADSACVQIDSIDDDGSITLASAYTGSASGTGNRTLLKPYTGSGGAVAVGSGALTLTSGTTNSAVTGVKRFTDYAPLVFRARVTVSQRIANQEVHIGLEEDTATPRWFARFLLTGTVNTTVVCETGRNPTGAPSASETQTSTVTLPNGATTAAARDYRIELLTESVRFYVDKVLVAEHANTIPHQHDEMTSHVEVRNGTGAASTTTVTVDYMTGKNHNKLEVGIMSDAEQIVVQQPDLVPYTYSQAGVIAINTVLLNVDCSRLREVGIQCSAMGTTGVVTPEWSNDGATWAAATIVTSAGVTATTFNAAGLWRAPVFARFLRLRLSTATTAGTTTLSLVGFAQGAGVMPAQTVVGTVTASLPAGSTAFGDVGLQYRASSTGGASVASVLSPATPAATSVKGTSGRLLGWQLVNTSAAVRSVKVWNTATGSITLGTTAALWEIDLPAGGRSEVNLEGGIAFATAISYAITGAKGLTDNTGGLGVNDVSGTFFYA